MTVANDTLHTAFLEDHQHLTQGLTSLRDSLRDSDAPRATVIARGLDQAVGPHMAFEESVLYPALVDRLGSAFVDRLYHEHTLGQTAVAQLVRRDASAPFTPTERETLIEQVETALEHALSCGSLLSYVDTLSPAHHADMLKQLLEMRAQGRLWTDLPGRPGIPPDGRSDS